ncbi:amino acid ABC transporter permease [Boudabousia marimammalium]|uniref:ABC transporter permease n=1 Tax=Boudabousia marimammalium TaxID=156892 RepID=A0A1Q5PR10_9ACTO|nr:amino acid ABC transporter permease [Boudabousia marimammalium]OKL50061.1 ABC transporter permease [Boudabousia marimammalium]
MSTQSDFPELINARPVPKPSRWLSAAVVALLAAMFINGLVTNEKYRWDVVAQWLFAPTIVRGVLDTLLLTVLAMLLGIVLAITAATMRQSTNPIMRSVAWVYIWFFRGTPIYTQLIFWGLLPTLYSQMSLGIPFGPEFFVFDTQTVFTAFVSAVIGLGLNEGAYLAEIVRTGLNSVDKGQTEAAQALGMKHSTILWRIIIPQAMRVIVPPTGNETISMLKTTSLVVAIPVTTELTFAASRVGQRLYMPLPMLIVAALWYLAITSILMVGQHYLESYYGRGFNESDINSNGKRSRSLSRKQAAILAAGTTSEDPFVEYTP